MNNELTALYVTAASIGFFHTLFGPDHYLPFIVMSRARRWSLMKTGLITFICGLGHIIGSIILGAIGVLLGIGVMRLEALEAVRGNLAGWALIGFGLAYFVWGLRRIVRSRSHKHPHVHADTTDHAHLHDHTCEHTHPHLKEGKKNITPWVLFTIFVLGPCEPLIPILMYPAAKNSIAGLLGVTFIFGAVTIITMFGIVMISSLGVNLIPLGRLERYSHALAGAAICLCGVAIQFLGL
ncbi:sulfite exporter TauE/SafE family protein [Omnitrophica bacterium]|nr:sulfite exporter TauE/SafE family protein [Candidatus Omnitrophota bacterium]